MSNYDLEEIEKIINSAVTRVVHDTPSKKTLDIIEQMNRRLDDHIDQHTQDTLKLNDRFNPDSEHYLLKDVQPIILAYQGSKMLGEITKWLAGLAVAYLALKGFRL